MKIKLILLGIIYAILSSCTISEGGNGAKTKPGKIAFDGVNYGIVNAVERMESLLKIDSYLQATTSKEKEEIKFMILSEYNIMETEPGKVSIINSQKSEQMEINITSSSSSLSSLGTKWLIHTSNEYNSSTTEKITIENIGQDTWNVTYKTYNNFEFGNSEATFNITKISDNDFKDIQINNEYQIILDSNDPKGLVTSSTYDSKLSYLRVSYTIEEPIKVGPLEIEPYYYTTMFDGKIKMNVTANAGSVPPHRFSDEVIAEILDYNIVNISFRNVTEQWPPN